jgi:hypothetical protein
MGRIYLLRTKKTPPVRRLEEVSLFPGKQEPAPASYKTILTAMAESFAVKPANFYSQLCRNAIPMFSLGNLSSLLRQQEPSPVVLPRSFYKYFKPVCIFFGKNSITSYSAILLTQKGSS